LAEAAAEQKKSFFEALPHFTGKGKALGALQHFHGWFSNFSSRAPQLSPTEAAEEVLDASGYLKALEIEGTIEAESRAENLRELLRSMEEFEAETAGNLAAYLDRISLVADMDSHDPNAQALSFMTVHNSKGLEFNSVFVVGLEEGIFPHQRSIDAGGRDEIEEERRLCYVAMTRAKRQLILTAARRRRLYHATQMNPVSRFIGEVPARYLVHLEEKGRSDVPFWPSAQKARPSYDEYRQDFTDEVSWPSQKKAKGTILPMPYTPGTRVVHPDFGIGTIRKREGNADNLKLTIQFQRAGLKKILLNYTSLERVDG